MAYEILEYNTYSVYMTAKLTFSSGRTIELFGEILLEADTVDKAIEEAYKRYNLADDFCLVEKECTEIDEVFVDRINFVCGSKETFKTVLESDSAWPLNSDSPMANLTFYNMLKRGEQTIYKAPVYAVYHKAGMSSDGPEFYLSEKMALKRVNEVTFLTMECFNKEEE